MKRIRQYLMYMMCIALCASCKKFLEVTPESSATTGNAYKTSKDMEAALTGVYNTLYQEYFIWDRVLLGDARSDNAYSGGDDQEVNQYDALKISSSNSRATFDYRQLFNGVARANLVIDKIRGVNDPQLTAARKAQITGEAKFLRAYYYFELLKLYGNIPLVTDFGSVDASKVNVPAATADKVYKQIIADLNDALVLPDDYGQGISVNKSRATKGAVNSLLAQVYAQMPNPDYNEVVTYCNAVINSPAGYDLHPIYNQLFDGSHYINSEAILEVQFIANTAQANWGPQLFLPPSLTGDDWRKYCTPSVDLVKAYDNEGDTERKNTNILMANAEWADEYWKPCASSGQIPFVFKWEHANAYASGDYTYLIRLADIILLKAEAQNELGNISGTDGAIALLNKIRGRAHLTGKAISDKETVKTYILNERRLELAFEGTRFNDLVRAGKFTTTMNALKEYKLNCGNANREPVNYAANNDKKLLPIPASELNRNNQLKQNPGY